MQVRWIPILLLSLLASPASRLPVRAAETLQGGSVHEFLLNYCADCHSGSAAEAGLDLDLLGSSPIDDDNLHQWVDILQMLEERVMPPAEMPQPEADELASVAGWIDGELTRVSCELNQPGRVTLRRLNRAEYNNTIRDLVGIDFQPASDFPADDVGNGFDNIADVLSMSPILTEKYMNAASDVVDHLWTDAEAKSRIVTCRPDEERQAADCLRAVLTPFAARAFRRPATKEEIDRLLQIASLAEEQGADYEEQLQWTLKAVLLSPHFLFKIEQDPAEPGSIRELDGYEMATRLSYFLWSSMPDAELLDLAAQGKLQDDQVLRGQVQRMLADDKAQALVSNFAGQWLQLRNLNNISPDPEKYPAFDDALRSAMLRETELLFEAVIREDRSVLEFLDGDFTYLNERLARHYGVEGIEGDEFRRVSLPANRRGVLTHASILTLTSNPTRTSPVKRGKWILENMLGSPPPPPPPGAGELEEGEVELLGSLRERTEQHRADPNCATCHQRMDPLGFGLENFDGIGSWRAKDGRFDIDASGVLPDGQAFDGPVELMQVLRNARSEDFCRCLTEKMLTYALGRGLQAYDRCTVEEVLSQIQKDDHRFSSLVTTIVLSEPFRKRGS